MSGEYTSYGKVCYQAYVRYCASTVPGWVEDVSWDYMSSQQQGAWDAAADAVLSGSEAVMDFRSKPVTPQDVAKYVEHIKSADATISSEKTIFISGTQAGDAAVVKALKSVWPEDRVSAATTAASIESLVRTLADRVFSEHENPSIHVISGYASAIRDLTLSAVEWRNMSRPPR